MKIYFNYLLSRVFRKIAHKMLVLSNKCLYKKSKMIESGVVRNLYITSSGLLFWLNTTGQVDNCIINTGAFEPEATKIVNRLVKEGDIVLDVGANIGYYTVIFSKLVGKAGKVIAFEPTDHFGKYLRMTLDANNAGNVDVYPIGLSNKNAELVIDIGKSSATLHPEPEYDTVIAKEQITLTTLDEFLESYPVPKIDFIKIDVDGHEPLFFEGARKTLSRFDPVILLEISHLHYLNAGFTAWEFYDMLVKNKYNIYHEIDFCKIKSKEEFLMKCGNFSQSANIIISKKDINLVH